jgi:hypothetical protein
MFGEKNKFSSTLFLQIRSKYNPLSNNWPSFFRNFKDYLFDFLFAS